MKTAAVGILTPIRRVILSRALLQSALSRRGITESHPRIGSFGAARISAGDDRPLQ